MPARRPSLRQMRSSFAVWASCRGRGRRTPPSPVRRTSTPCARRAGAGRSRWTGHSDVRSRPGPGRGCAVVRSAGLRRPAARVADRPHPDGAPAMPPASAAVRRTRPGCSARLGPPARPGGSRRQGRRRRRDHPPHRPAPGPVRRAPTAAAAAPGGCGSPEWGRRRGPARLPSHASNRTGSSTPATSRISPASRPATSLITPQRTRQRTCPAIGG